jgi:hypothetical protein
MRELTQDEIGLVRKLLDREVAGAEQLRAQLINCLVYPINDDETILRCCVSEKVSPAKVPYLQNVAVDAGATDLDGGLVEVLLHVNDGKLYEIEYVKADGTPLIRRPLDSDLSEFMVYW